MGLSGLEAFCLRLAVLFFGVSAGWWPGNPGLRAHAPYLKRIMDNLLSNALKFSQPGKTVRVEAGEIESMVVLRVIDQGPGIPQAELPRLFQKVKRLSNRPTGGESSTGLGLFIGVELCQAMGGKVEVESEAGKGSTFSAVLPLC